MDATSGSVGADVVNVGRSLKTRLAADPPSEDEARELDSRLVRLPFEARPSPESSATWRRGGKMETGGSGRGETGGVAQEGR